MLTPVGNSKASASILAVDERQSLETLSRDEKTAGRTLAQPKDKLEQLTQKRVKSSEEDRTQSQKKAEVNITQTWVGDMTAKITTARREGVRVDGRTQAREAGAR